MAGLLSNEVNNTEKIAVLVSECQRLGITILPPNMNRSQLKFVPETTDELLGIRYGLAAIKNIGESAMQAAIDERARDGAFNSLEDYCARLDSRSVNRKTLENLIRAGAFDFIGKDRAELFAQIDQSLAAGVAVQRDRVSGQVSLFEELDLAPSRKSSGNGVSYTPWTLSEKLAFEKELLGFYVTGHPLDAYRNLIESGKYLTISELPNLEDKSVVQVAGSISAVDRKFARKDGKPFAVITMEDFSGQVEVMVWSDAYSRSAPEIEKGKIVAATARLDRREDSVRLIASEIGPLPAPETPGRDSRSEKGALTIDIPMEKADEERLVAIRTLVQRYPGPQPLFLRFRAVDGRVLKLKASGDYSVRDDTALRTKLAELLA
jgi:DNA polymerase-3 subunit alpha